MTATPTWSINTLDRSLPDGIVTTIHWSVSLTEDGFSAGAYGTIGLGEPDPDAFTPYDDLSPEQVIDWLHDTMGADLVTAYEASLAAQIEEQRNPKQATGLPWTASPSTPDAATPPGDDITDVPTPLSDDTTDAPTPLSDDTTEPLTPDAT